MIFIELFSGEVKLQGTIATVVPLNVRFNLCRRCDNKANSLNSSSSNKPFLMWRLFSFPIFLSVESFPS